MYSENKDVRVLYLGTAEIAVKPLLSLLKSGFNVVGVVCQEDKVGGRGGNQIEIPPVKKLAQKALIPVFQPHKIRKDFSFARQLEFDVIVCMAYGQIVPMDFINLAPKKAINLHGSLLPKLRGAAPIQRSIMNGEKITGVTLMEMAEKMDAGRMYDKREIVIEDTDNYSTLTSKMSDAAAEMIVSDLLKYVNDELTGIPQKEEEVTFAEKILPENEKLPLDLPSKEMNCYIRGLADTPGAYVIFRDKKLKVYSSEITNDIKLENGMLKPIKGKLYLGTNDGSLLLEDVQFEGKKRMNASSFLNGARIDKNGEKVF